VCFWSASPSVGVMASLRGRVSPLVDSLHSGRWAIPWAFAFAVDVGALRWAQNFSSERFLTDGAVPPCSSCIPVY
jgi:hypothetical protein